MRVGRLRRRGFSDGPEALPQARASEFSGPRQAEEFGLPDDHVIVPDNRAGVTTLGGAYTVASSAGGS
jgi:hypothetical protein